MPSGMLPALRAKPERRPATALWPPLFNTNWPLKPGLLAFFTINDGAPSSVALPPQQALVNVAVEESNWSYPASASLFIVPAMNGFGGTAATSTVVLITITNVNPVVDLSSTGPGLTMACWCCVGITPSAITAWDVFRVATAGTGYTLRASSVSGSGNLPGVSNGTDTLTGGKFRFRQWTLLAFTLSGSSLVLYQNGEEVARNNAITGIATTAANSLIINTSGGTGNFFCNAMIWTRPLSPSEMRYLWQPQTRWNMYTQSPRRIPFSFTPPVVSFLPRLAVLGSG